MLLLYSYLFVCGACSGSFITCMAERLSANLPIGNGSRSRCPHCGHSLRWWQLLPLLGVLLQRGHCFDCRTQISLRSSYIELLCALLLVTTSTNDWWSVTPLLLGYGALLFNSVTDYLTLNVYPVTLILPALFGLWQQPPRLTGDTLILATLLILLYLIARHTNKFGLGDVDVLIMLSALSSPATVIVSLTLATVGALLVFVCQGRPGRLPFVPFITWGFILCSQLSLG